MIDPDTVAGVILPALVSGAVTWGVMRTELRWLRADVNRAHKRLDALERGPHRHRRRDDPVDA